MPYSAEDRHGLRRIILAASAGTIFEAYDFILFGSLAPIISRQFFAGVNPTAGFIFALLTFAAGYLIRPLGALYFGSMGDRAGRKKAFVITISIMGAATFAIGLLPTYATAGLLAPVVLVVLRLLQGLAFGGEYGGAVVYTAEHAPAGQRGLFVGWIQAAAGFGLFLSFFIVWLTRTALGEDSFADWGWRLPFLLSVLLLGISLWMRLRLEESPLFLAMLRAGKSARHPLRETFGHWPNLRLVLLVLFGLMLMQGVIFYTAHFYSQFFLTQVLKLPPAQMSFIMMLTTFISVPLYVLFSWWSDKVGRKPVILAGAILSLLTSLPIFHMFTALVNPALAEAEVRAPVVITADAALCSLQFDPVGQAEFVSSCDIAKSTLATLGISYSNERGSPFTRALVQVGGQVVQSVEGAGLDRKALALARIDFGKRLDKALRSAGYPASVDPEMINMPLLAALLMLMLVFSTMVYAPVPAMALELFATRIRYTGLSLPYHIGSGWFGGFLPAIAFAMVAANGSVYFGLLYPLIMTGISILVLAFMLPETRNRDLQEID